MLVTKEKEPSEYFQQLHFSNQWVPLIKTQCKVCYLLDFDLGQVCSILQILQSRNLDFQLLQQISTLSKTKAS